MADPAAAASVDKSVQVKLVLLGMWLSVPLFLLSFDTQKGEAAVGKSSVVLRFVSRVLSIPQPWLNTCP